MAYSNNYISLVYVILIQFYIQSIEYFQFSIALMNDLLYADHKVVYEKFKQVIRKPDMNV